MDRTEVHLDELHQIAHRFALESQQINEMQSKLRLSVDRLVNSGWIGRGADRFFDEMYEELLPALNRLMEALGEAAIRTNKISDVYQRAQETASDAFRNVGEAEAGGTYR